MLKITFITLALLLSSSAFAQDSGAADQAPPTESGKTFLNNQIQRLRTAEKNRADAIEKKAKDLAEKLTSSQVKLDEEMIQQYDTALKYFKAAVDQTKMVQEKSETQAINNIQWDKNKVLPNHLVGQVTPQAPGNVYSYPASP